MLVNCPKCGFSQPQDRYCASCGIDMNIYRPLSTPIWKKTITHPLLHVTLIFLLVLASVLFIRQRHNEELRARVEYLKSGPVLMERQQASSVQVSASPDAESALAGKASPVPPEETTMSASALAQPPPSLPNPPPPPPETTLSPGPTNLQKTAKSADSRSAKKFVTIYAEIDSRILNAWVDEMRSTGQLRTFDDAFMGPLPQVSQKLKSGRGVKILSRMEHQMAPSVLSLEWFVGTHRGDPENEIGFFSSLALGDSKDGVVRGDIEVQRAFREPQGGAGKPIERVSFGSPFELAPGAGYLMRGILPRRFATELDEEANPDPALAVLKSRSFASGETEFAFILEFEPSAAASPKTSEK
jgi:hypothetical protein